MGGKLTLFNAVPILPLCRSQVQEETLERLSDFGNPALAIIDIWLLSFCDEILSSALSSFGAMAAAIAGIRPVAMNIVRRDHWVDYRTDNDTMCLKHTSIEPCGTLNFLHRRCHREGFNDSYHPEYVGPCLDHKSSFQVYTSD